MRATGVGITLLVQVNSDTPIAPVVLGPEDGGNEWAALEVGEGLGQVTILTRDLLALARLGEAVATLHRRLAEELGLLPNGEPCRFSEMHTSLEWHEHDHDRCLAEMVDEPVPYMPTPLGSAWERHDDPTASAFQESVAGWS